MLDYESHKKLYESCYLILLPNKTDNESIVETLVEGGYTKEESTEMINEEPATAGTIAMGVILGKLGYDVLGVLLVGLIAGGAFTFSKLKAAWDRYRKISKDKKVKAELESFAKSSKAFDKVKAAYDEYNRFSKTRTMKEFLKGTRGDDRKERQKEYDAQLNSLKQKLSAAHEELKREFNQAKLSQETINVITTRITG